MVPSPESNPVDGSHRGHKPALKFSSRRASAFQRPWMAPGSSEASALAKAGTSRGETRRFCRSPSVEGK